MAACSRVYHRQLYYYTIQVLHYTILHYTILYCTVLYYTMQYYTTLYYIILYEYYKIHNWFLCVYGTEQRHKQAMPLYFSAITQQSSS